MERVECTACFVIHELLGEWVDSEHDPAGDVDSAGDDHEGQEIVQEM